MDSRPLPLTPIPAPALEIVPAALLRYSHLETRGRTQMPFGLDPARRVVLDPGKKSRWQSFVRPSVAPLTDHVRSEPLTPRVMLQSRFKRPLLRRGSRLGRKSGGGREQNLPSKAPGAERPRRTSTLAVGVPRLLRNPATLRRAPPARGGKPRPRTGPTSPRP